MKKRKRFKKTDLFKISVDRILKSSYIDKNNFELFFVKKGEIGIILDVPKTKESKYYYVYIDGKYGFLNEIFMDKIKKA